MTQEEKKLLRRAQFEVQQILISQNTGVPIIKNLEPNLNQLLEMLEYLRISTKYELLDLEATRREKASLEKALRDKQ